MIDFFKGILLELQNIKWLSRETLLNYTLIVLITSAFISLFLFISDLIFSKIIITLLH